jgi:tRNA threonylcarbamoyladenosine biosynthesis protein TsaE
MNTGGGSLDVISHSVTSTRRLGQRLAMRLRGGDVVLLTGHLGAGKTTLVQGIATGLEIAGPVNSPTFTLINEYAGVTSEGQPVNLYHIDLYRLDPDGATTLGLEDYLEDPAGIAVIEWPEAAPLLMPATALVVEIDLLSETKRRLALRAIGPDAGRYGECLAALRQELFGAAAR